MTSFDESLLAHEAIFARYRGLHTGETYEYTRGDIRSMQAAVTMGHLIERAYRDGEALAQAQAAADAEPPPQCFGVLGAMRMGA